MRRARVASVQGATVSDRRGNAKLRGGAVRRINIKKSRALCLFPMYFIYTFTYIYIYLSTAPPRSFAIRLLSDTFAPCTDATGAAHFRLTTRGWAGAIVSEKNLIKATIVSAIIDIPMRYSGLFPHLKEHYYDECRRSALRRVGRPFGPSAPSVKKKWACKGHFSGPLWN